MELLLAHGEVDPDKPNNDSQTPLWFASLNGNEAWRDYYSRTMMSIPTSQTAMIKHRPGALL